MFLLRLLLKLILMPVMLAVTLLQWIGIFLTGFSSVIFYILSGIVFLTAVLSCGGCDDPERYRRSYGQVSIWSAAVPRGQTACL